MRLSAPEAERLTIIRKVLVRRLNRRTAAHLLSCSKRTVARLCARVRRNGAAGVVHAAKGRPSLRRMDPRLMESVLSALCAEDFAGLGPKSAHERLRAEYGLALSRETVRKAMRAADLPTGRLAPRRAAGRIGLRPVAASTRNP